MDELGGAGGEGSRHTSLPAWRMNRTPVSESPNCSLHVFQFLLRTGLCAGKKAETGCQLGMTGAVSWHAQLSIGTRFFACESPFGKGLPCLRSILKVLALSGVISAGCFCGLEGQQRLAPANAAKPDQFTALPDETDDNDRTRWRTDRQAQGRERLAAR